MTAASPYVVALDGRGALPHQVGGKGAWLDRLAAAALPTPTAVALSTDAYREVAANPTVAALLVGLAADPTPAPADFPDIERRIDEVFLGIDLPAGIAAGIAAAAAACRPTPDTPLAARSSATAEDMSATSFAGQYRSFLDLRTDTDVERAVRLVWASLWYPAPVSYRRFHGVVDSDVAMAVVVMPMVAAQKAGVAFTVDPAGSNDDVRVEMVTGLGEQLVSGKVTPVVTLVPRSIRAPSAADAPGDLANAVALLALRVEDALGAPQDVEWAWDGSSLLLLQARPITSAPAPSADGRESGDGFDTATGPDERWTTAGIAETLVGTLPPLLWDTAGHLVEASFRELFDALEVLPDLPPSTRLIGRFRGRAALNLGLMEAVAADLPGGSPQEVEWQDFGRSAGQRPATEAGSGISRLADARHDVAVLQLRNRASREAETVIVATALVVESDDAYDAPIDELLLNRRRLLDLAGRSVTAETAVATSAVAAYRRLEAWLLRHFEQRDAERWAQRITTVPRAGVDWADVARGTDGLGPALTAELAGVQTWSQAEDLLNGTAAGREWRDRIRAEARRAGSAGMFAGPTWEESLDTVWPLLRAALTEPRDAHGGKPATSAWPELVAALQEQPGWSKRGSLIGELFDVRLVVLRRLVDDAVELLGRRERAKAAVLALGGQVRSVHLAIGRQLAAVGRLETPEDVHLLGEAELAAAAAGGAGPSLAELARRRRWLDRCTAQGPLPPVFTGPPVDSVGVPLSGGARFQGWGASPGVAIGRGVVLTGPSSDLGRGDILVAQNTDASWSPLFLRAAAIVVEQGGPLSHAAIVARELGIPAVLNVPGVVAAAGGRQTTITVDGDHGLVVIG